jgi:hypothetical protein
MYGTYGLVGTAASTFPELSVDSSVYYSTNTYFQNVRR